MPRRMQVDAASVFVACSRRRCVEEYVQCQAALACLFG